MKRKSFFTIVELLVVMAIIGIIMAVLLPALSKARAVGKRTACLSQLRQIGTGMMLYKIDNNMNTVPWTSLLYPEYVTSNKVYLCPADLNKEVNKSLNPSLSDNDPEWRARIDNEYNEVYDRPKPSPNPSNKNVGLYGAEHNNNAGNVSYFYEMSEKETSSGSAKTWAMDKEDQVKSYSVSAFPVYRCFWHIRNIKKYSESNKLNDVDPPVINITYSGNYVLSKLTWENGVWSP
jgi:type II secretory pathway pseudopilin PulG